jgi:UDP-N-acetyl-D-glucosamine dehydrogenase
VRESPALDVMSLLLDKGAEITFSDPFVSEVEIRGQKLTSVAADAKTVSAADAVLLLTDHTAFDRPGIAKAAGLLIDTRNAFKGIAGDHILRV